MCGPLAPAAQHDADPATTHTRLDVLIGRVRHELVEGVLGILVGLAGDQHGLRQVPDAEADLLRRHGHRVSHGAAHASLLLRAEPFGGPGAGGQDRRHLGGEQGHEQAGAAGQEHG